MIAAALIGFASIYVLWVFYLAVMNLQRARDAGTLTRTARLFGMPVLYVGLVIDCLVNILVLTIMFAELPKETLVTSRLIRHKHSGPGWRRSLAAWFCVNLLDAFDPSGCHCK